VTCGKSLQPTAGIFLAMQEKYSVHFSIYVTPEGNQRVEYCSWMIDQKSLSGNKIDFISMLALY